MILLSYKYEYNIIIDYFEIRYKVYKIQFEWQCILLLLRVNTDFNL